MSYNTFKRRFIKDVCNAQPDEYDYALDAEPIPQRELIDLENAGFGVYFNQRAEEISVLYALANIIPYLDLEDPFAQLQLEIFITRANNIGIEVEIN